MRWIEIFFFVGRRKGGARSIFVFPPPPVSPSFCLALGYEGNDRPSISPVVEKVEAGGGLFNALEMHSRHSFPGGLAKGTGRKKR